MQTPRPNDLNPRVRNTLVELDKLHAKVETITAKQELMDKTIRMNNFLIILAFLLIIGIQLYVWNER